MNENTLVLLTLVDGATESKFINLKLNKSTKIEKTSAVLYAAMCLSSNNSLFDFEECLYMMQELHTHIFPEKKPIHKVFLSGINIYPFPLGYDCNDKLVIASNYLGQISNIIPFEKLINSNIPELTDLYGYNFGDIKNNNDFQLRMPYIYIENKENIILSNIISINKSFYYSENATAKFIISNLKYIGIEIKDPLTTALEIINTIKKHIVNDNEGYIDVECVNGKSERLKFGFKDENYISNYFS